MHDYQELFPRSVCGCNWRRRLRVKSLDRLGSILAEIYKLDLDDDDRRDAIALYDILRSDCHLFIALGLDDADPVPHPSTHPGYLEKRLRRLYRASESIGALAVAYGIDPGPSVFNEDI